MAPATSPRSNKIKTTTGPVRFTIQLQFIYSIYQTLYHWPGRGITPAFRTENSRKLALPVRLQDFNTSPGHRSWKLELLLCLVFLLSVPLLRPWVRGDGVGYYAFVRAPLFEQSFDFTHDYQHANPSFGDQRVDGSGQPKSLTLGRNCVSIASRNESTGRQPFAPMNPSAP